MSFCFFLLSQRVVQLVSDVSRSSLQSHAKHPGRRCSQHGGSAWGQRACCFPVTGHGMSYQLVQYVLNYVNVHQGGYSFTCLAEWALIKRPLQDWADLCERWGQKYSFLRNVAVKLWETTTAQTNHHPRHFVQVSSILSAHVCVFSANNLLLSLLGVTDDTNSAVRSCFCLWSWSIWRWRPYSSPPPTSDTLSPLQPSFTSARLSPGYTQLIALLITS